MTRLLANLHVPAKVYPPIELLEPHIDRATDAHWYWEGDIYIDPFSRTPVFYWRPDDQGPRGRFVVARVLWAHANGAGAEHHWLRNTCGVYACVNPAHWRDLGTRGKGPR